ncbi:MAG: glycine cleavage system protein T [Deltaproteobacteria bacterium]|nr:glycine cleavage system protein T [Deltaproteobacteria bacterium]MBU48554.1 glycine cleavage system protein T [Deltaproteobacteria bacterium]|tara:strand:+ start:3264 stop:4385 length:1122 start_codon:yes stop_codon:yes gene_type:complete
MSENTRRRTPLYDCHVAAKGRMVDFAGWDLPVQYEGVKAEHLAVREHVGVFDVSHMGRMELTGADAEAALQRWITNDVSVLAEGEACYSPICYPEGGIVDDGIFYRRGDNDFLIVINGANREKDYKWFCDNIREGEDVTLTHPDAGDKWALLAVQGPKARGVLGRMAGQDLTDVPKNRLVEATLSGIDGCMLACTGYTGEDGFEVFVPADRAVDFWNALFEEGAQDQIMACGLGARDTLRMEMRYPLYGNDIDETTTPIEAGLSWTVKPKKGDFNGRDVLVEQMESKPPRRLVGIEMIDRGVPRSHYKLFSADGSEEIGELTSGGFAPSLGKSIGIGYVPAKPHFAKPGSELKVEIRNKKLSVRVVKTPFYRP